MINEAHYVEGKVQKIDRGVAVIRFERPYEFEYRGKKIHSGILLRESELSNYQNNGIYRFPESIVQDRIKKIVDAKIKKEELKRRNLENSVVGWLTEGQETDDDFDEPAPRPIIISMPYNPKEEKK